MVSILGIDASLTQTGWCIKKGLKSNDYVTGVLKSKFKDSKRLFDLGNQLRDLMTNNRLINVVVLEGYSFGSKGSRVFSIGELGGVFKYVINQFGAELFIVSPTALKKFATGKGNAKKEIMIKEAYKQYGYEFDNNDECDAFWLVKYYEQVLRGVNS